MFHDARFGNLFEPMTGRKWDRRAALAAILQRVAFFQKVGMQPSDRVFLLYGNQLEFFADVMAVWMLGGCVIPVDARLTPFEIETLARAAGPRFAIGCDSLDAALASALTGLKVAVLNTMDAATHSTSAAQIPPAGALSLDQDALVLFTSGTTGQPKGVVHTHRTLRARWMGLRANLDLKEFRRTL
ncbi:MAG TPA: class I adenylate-forming enzyme family protein, partial [Kiritimatiellia bacterium]